LKASEDYLFGTPLFYFLYKFNIITILDSSSLKIALNRADLLINSPGYNFDKFLGLASNLLLAGRPIGDHPLILPIMPGENALALKKGQEISDCEVLGVGGLDRLAEQDG
jgi:hypothetical protein